MNCTKPDELAVVNWPNASAHNHIVTTKEFIAQNTRIWFCGKPRYTADGPAWWVESPAPVLSIHGPVSRFPIYDKHLRPIGTPEHGGVEETSFQKPIVTTKTETLQQQIAALNEARKYRGSQA